MTNHPLHLGIQVCTYSYIPKGELSLDRTYSGFLFLNQQVKAGMKGTCKRPIILYTILLCTANGPGILYSYLLHNYIIS